MCYSTRDVKISSSFIHFSQHYQVPRIPAQPTSFNPTYVNLEIGVKSKQAHKKLLIPSKSAPQQEPAAGDSLPVCKSYLESEKCRTPPARTSRRDRPMSSYVPNGEQLAVIQSLCFDIMLIHVLQLSDIGSCGCLHPNIILCENDAARFFELGLHQGQYHSVVQILNPIFWFFFGRESMVRVKSPL